MSGEMAPDVAAYTASKEWKWRRRGSELEMECPLCHHGNGRDNRFFINAVTGLWDCKHCGEHGNLWGLKRLLGDLRLRPVTRSDALADALRARASRGKGVTAEQPHRTPQAGEWEREQERLFSDAGAAVLSYLTGVRGFAVETLRHFRFGARALKLTQKWPVTDPDSGQPVLTAEGNPVVEERTESVPCVAVPFFAGGRHVNTKYRTVPPAPKDFRRVTGCASALFGADDIKAGPGQAVIVTEGEMDAVALWQYGYGNVVSGSTGAKGWDEEWLTALDAFDTVYLCYDNDEATGDEGADRLAVALGRHRCHRVLLPLKDANDCLAAGVTADEIKAAFDAARPYELRELVKPGVFRERVERARACPEKVRGEPTGWPSLDLLLGGWRLGELVVVTGDTSAGKTQWVLNAVWLQATTGRAAAVFSFENPAEDANMILLGMEAGGDPLTVSHDVFDKAYRSLDAKPITLFDHYGEIGLSQLKESVYFAARRCMAEVVVLDHLHFFLEVPDPRYERQAIDRAMREIKLWAKDLHVLILLVSHPRQTRSDSEKVDMSDLKGSSSIKQDADVVLRVWRKRTVDRTQKGAPCGYVTVLKCRKRYGQEGTVCLAFDQRSGRFSDEIGGAGSAAW